MSSDLEPGAQLAEYKIERLIGRGGMGVVYQAEHVHLGKRVALKVLPTEYTKDGTFRERFEREARLAASLEHPNIVPVTDAGEFEGELWIAMRFVDGTDLREVLHAHGTLNPIRAVSILGRVANALDTAHAAGLVHRDVKPGNILLEPPSPTRQVEHVYLTDFGLTKQVDAEADDVAGQFAGTDAPKHHQADADIPDHGPLGPDHGPLGSDDDGGSTPDRQLTRAGYFAGTVDYAAPEQFRGEPLDGRVDVYALGCVLYECLTGKTPFTGEDDQRVMLMHIQTPPPKASAVVPGIPRGIDAVIARAMAKDRDARFATCREMVDAARSFLAGWDPSSAAGMPAAPGPPPGSLVGTPSGSYASVPSTPSVASDPSVPSTPSVASTPSAASDPSVSSTPSVASDPSLQGAPSALSGSFAGAVPAASSPSQSVPPVAAPPALSQPSSPSTPGPASGTVPAPPLPPASSPSNSGVAPPPAPVPPAAPARRSGIGGSNPLLTWILIGAGAAIVLVLVLVLFAK